MRIRSLVPVVAAGLLVLLFFSCGNPVSEPAGIPTPSLLTIQLQSDSVVYTSWTQCSDNDFDAYILWRSQSAGIEADPSQAQAIKIFTGDPLQNTWFDSDVIAGETYWYALETRNTALLSAWSNELSLTIPLNEPDNLTVFFIDPSHGSYRRWRQKKRLELWQGQDTSHA